MMKQFSFRFFLFVYLFFLFCFDACASTAYSPLIIESDAGPAPIIEAIQQAHSSVDMAMYGLTDERILQALVQAKNAGKQVRVLLQHFPYKYTDENKLAIQRFSAQHIAYVFPSPLFYLLHQKTLIIDHRLAMVMTFNFTRSTFKNERNFGLMITDPAMVEEIQRVFDADWQHKTIIPRHLSLLWSPDNSRQKILDLIASAQSEIKVYAQGLSDYRVIGALAEAARRGVIVQIVTSGSQPGRKWDYLQRAGVQFHRDHSQMIHAKVIIVDQKKAMLGSINFTAPSLDRNRELSVITSDSKIVHELVYVFQRDFLGRR